MLRNQPTNKYLYGRSNSYFFCLRARTIESANQVTNHELPAQHLKIIQRNAAITSWNIANKAAQKIQCGGRQGSNMLQSKMYYKSKVDIQKETPQNIEN